MGLSGFCRAALLHGWNNSESSFRSELESHLSVGELLVDLRDDAGFILDVGSALFVQEDLHVLGSIEVESHSLSNNDSWRDEVLENGIVDGGQGAVSGDLLIEVGFFVDLSSVDDDEGGEFLLLLNIVDDFWNQALVVLVVNERKVNDQSGVYFIIVIILDFHFSDSLDDIGSDSLFDIGGFGQINNDLVDISVNSTSLVAAGWGNNFSFLDGAVFSFLRDSCFHIGFSAHIREAL